jgi:hypothetical protein
MDAESSNNAEKSLAICALFESELLVWLMLRNWNHPLAEDREFRSQLLERATEVLTAAVGQGRDHAFIEGVPAKDMNLVAAFWYAEWLAVEPMRGDDERHRESRIEWLNKVRRALPSCFCAVDDLPPNEFI